MMLVSNIIVNSFSQHLLEIDKTIMGGAACGHRMYRFIIIIAVSFISKYDLSRFVQLLPVPNYIRVLRER